MYTPEQIEYTRNLSDADSARFIEIYSTYVGLGLVGCDSCEFSEHINAQTQGQVMTMSAHHDMKSMSHYSIELNALMHEGARTNNPALLPENRLDQNKLFTILMRMGLPEEEFDVVCGAFKKCIDCDSALKTVGRNRTFEETKAILEARIVKD